MSTEAINLTRSLERRIALVTGGARGIGRETVECLVGHGANVAFTYNRSQVEAQELAERWPGRVSHHQLDLRNRDSIGRCVDEVIARWGSLHITVNNAAAGSATIADYEPNAARVDEALFEVNAIGAFHMCQRVLAAMAQSEGRCKLINIASVGGIQVFPSMRLADNMSKAAMVYMTRQIAAENAHTNIDVFALCPGATDTAMFRRSTLDRLDAAGQAELLAQLPGGRLIRPDEVAHVIAFLASEYSTILRGAVLDASLGLGVHPGLITGTKAGGARAH